MWGFSGFSVSFLAMASQVQTLGLKTPLEFNEGDVGMAGGIQARSHTDHKATFATQQDSS